MKVGDRVRIKASYKGSLSGRTGTLLLEYGPVWLVTIDNVYQGHYINSEFLDPLVGNEKPGTLGQFVKQPSAPTGFVPTKVTFSPAPPTAQVNQVTQGYSTSDWPTMNNAPSTIYPLAWDGGKDYKDGDIVVYDKNGTRHYYYQHTFYALPNHFKITAPGTMVDTRMNHHFLQNQLSPASIAEWDKIFASYFGPEPEAVNQSSNSLSQSLPPPAQPNDWKVPYEGDPYL